MGISIVICCHNGRTRLVPTLRALAQCLSKVPVEVIFVDNASTDGSGEVVREAWGGLASPFELRIIREAKLGLAFARKAGALAAKYDSIVFCDDDNWLAPDYLSVAHEIMSDATVGAAGGQIEPVFDGPVPTFAFSHGTWLALGVQALCSGDVTRTRGFLWGAGLVLRRSSLLEIYRCRHFPIRVGRTGTDLAQGDDAEICWALRVLGKRLVYDERLKLKHFIPRERLDASYLGRLADAVDTDRHVARLIAGLEQMHRAGRLRSAIVSAIRWMWHVTWPAERRYQGHLFLASCGWQSRIGGIEGRICVAFESLRSRVLNSQPKASDGRNALRPATLNPPSVAIISDCDRAGCA